MKRRPGRACKAIHFLFFKSRLSTMHRIFSLLHESGPPVVMHRFGHATSAHDSFTGEALTSRFVPYSPVNEYLFACNNESADKPVPLCQLSMYVFFFKRFVADVERDGNRLALICSSTRSCISLLQVVRCSELTHHSTQYGSTQEPRGGRGNLASIVRAVPL